MGNINPLNNNSWFSQWGNGTTPKQGANPTSLHNQGINSLQANLAQQAATGNTTMTTGVNIYTGGTWQAIQRSQNEVPTDAVCRLCGTKYEVRYYEKDSLRLCQPCDLKVKEKILQLLMPTDSDVHCKKCFSHINACECPETKQMDALKS